MVEAILRPESLPVHLEVGTRAGLGAADRRWALVRLALGVAQMSGASAGLVLLVQTGANEWTLALIAATGVLTTLSVLLFGSWRGR